MRRAKPNVVNRAQLARLTGRSLPAVDSWIRRGLPVLGRNGPRGALQIDSAAAIAWLADQAAASAPSSDGPLDLDHERAREAHERANRYSLENGRARRELIPAERVEALWSERRTRARERFHDIPRRAATVLPDASPAALEGVLRLLDEALAELDGPAVPGTDDSAEPEAVHG